MDLQGNLPPPQLILPILKKVWTLPRTHLHVSHVCQASRSGLGRWTLSFGGARELYRGSLYSVSSCQSGTRGTLEYRHVWNHQSRLYPACILRDSLQAPPLPAGSPGFLRLCFTFKKPIPVRHRPSLHWLPWAAQRSENFPSNVSHRPSGMLEGQANLQSSLKR